MKRAAAALLLAAFGITAHAGRPLSTEDAGVVGHNACQLEAWIDRSREATTAWAVPACNFGLGIEWQAGFARTYENSESAFSESYVQAKKVFVEPTEGGWGFGLVVGLARIARRDSHRGWEDPYAIIPLTVTPDAKNTIHVNAGWSRNRETGSNSTLWGVAGEHALSDRVALVGEVFGTDRERPFVRFGTRVTAAKGLDFDVTFVARPGGSTADRYLSVGLTWVSN